MNMQKINEDSLTPQRAVKYNGNITGINPSVNVFHTITNSSYSSYYVFILLNSAS